jgi:hypothetical protein
MALLNRDAKTKNYGWYEGLTHQQHTDAAKKDRDKIYFVMDKMMAERLDANDKDIHAVYI